jgi:hypothetical protein
MLCFYHLGKKNPKQKKANLTQRQLLLIGRTWVVSASVQKSVYSSTVDAVKRGFDKGAHTPTPSPEDGRRLAW